MYPFHGSFTPLLLRWGVSGISTTCPGGQQELPIVAELLGLAPLQLPGSCSWPVSTALHIAYAQLSNPQTLRAPQWISGAPPLQKSLLSRTLPYKFHLHSSMQQIHQTLLGSCSPREVPPARNLGQLQHLPFLFPFSQGPQFCAAYCSMSKNS